VNHSVTLLIACLGLFPIAGGAKAQDTVFKSSGSSSSLIELYSSEGCSSCPPAEEWTNRLKDAPGLWKDVCPVAVHVDYWDGLGWPDRFARPEYTQRQRDHAARLNQDSVYTPEFVVNGQEWRRGWFSGQALPKEGAEKSGSLALTVNVKEKKISAEYTPGGSAAATGLVLNVAVLGIGITTDVKAGENGGRQLQHDFVVLGFSSTPLSAETDGAFHDSAVEIKSTVNDAPGAIVAWVSNADGAILQVTGGWLSARN
jgi:hypothetical protein